MPGNKSSSIHNNPDIDFVSKLGRHLVENDMVPSVEVECPIPSISSPAVHSVACDQYLSGVYSAKIIKQGLLAYNWAYDSFNRVYEYCLAVTLPSKSKAQMTEITRDFAQDLDRSILPEAREHASITLGYLSAIRQNTIRTVSTISGAFMEYSGASALHRYAKNFISEVGGDKIEGAYAWIKGTGNSIYDYSSSAYSFAYPYLQSTYSFVYPYLQSTYATAYPYLKSAYDAVGGKVSAAWQWAAPVQMVRDFGTWASGTVIGGVKGVENYWYSNNVSQSFDKICFDDKGVLVDTYKNHSQCMSYSQNVEQWINSATEKAHTAGSVVKDFGKNWYSALPDDTYGAAIKFGKAATIGTMNATVSTLPTYAEDYVCNVLCVASFDKPPSEQRKKDTVNALRLAKNVSKFILAPILWPVHYTRTVLDIFSSFSSLGNSYTSKKKNGVWSATNYVWALTAFLATSTGFGWYAGRYLPSTHTTTWWLERGTDLAGYLLTSISIVGGGLFVAMMYSVVARKLISYVMGGLHRLTGISVLESFESALKKRGQSIEQTKSDLVSSYATGVYMENSTKLLQQKLTNAGKHYGDATHLADRAIAEGWGGFKYNVKNGNIGESVYYQNCQRWTGRIVSAGRSVVRGFVNTVYYGTTYSINTFYSLFGLSWTNAICVPIVFLCSNMIVSPVRLMLPTYGISAAYAVLSIPATYIFVRGFVNLLSSIFSRNKKELNSAAKKWFQNDQISLPQYMQQESVAASCDMVSEKPAVNDCNNGTFFTMPFDLVNGIANMVNGWYNSFRADSIFAEECAESISPTTMQDIASYDPELCHIVKEVVYESSRKTLQLARRKASEAGGLKRANENTASAFAKNKGLISKVVHDVLSHDSVADDGMESLDIAGSTSCTNNLKEKTTHYTNTIVKNGGNVFPLTTMDDVKLVECVGKGFSAVTGVAGGR